MYLDAKGSSAGESGVARAGHVAIGRGSVCRRADKACAAVAFIAVLDAGVYIVVSIAALDARCRRVVRVLGRNVMRDYARRDVDGARVDRGPVERDSGRAECRCTRSERLH